MPKIYGEFTVRKKITALMAAGALSPFVLAACGDPGHMNPNRTRDTSVSQPKVKGTPNKEPSVPLKRAADGTISQDALKEYGGALCNWPGVKVALSKVVGGEGLKCFSVFGGSQGYDIEADWALPGSIGGVDTTLPAQLDVVVVPKAEVETSGNLDTPNVYTKGNGVKVLGKWGLLTSSDHGATSSVLSVGIGPAKYDAYVSAFIMGPNTVDIVKQEAELIEPILKDLAGKGYIRVDTNPNQTFVLDSAIEED